jgi:hypothetical protein
LDNPDTITLSKSYPTSTIPHDLCTGQGYVVPLENTKDYIIRTTEVLTAPVWIYGGRNVRIIGIQIDLATAPCATAGASGYVPGTIALRVYQVGTTFVEGAYIDVAGRSADCIDPRNFIDGFDALKGYTEADARGARDVVIQNSVCRGMSGDPNVHGDILQTQSMFELFRNITFENVSTDSNCEGTVIEPREGFLLANQIKMRRFDYQHDARYTPNNVSGVVYDGGPVQHSAKAYSYDQVYIYRNEPPYEMSPPISGWVGGTSYTVGNTVVWGGGNVYQCITAGTSASASSGGPQGTGSDITDGGAHWKYLRPQDPYTIARPLCNTGGIFCSAMPSQNRFASPGTGAATNAWTGLNYVSPH